MSIEEEKLNSFPALAVTPGPREEALVVEKVATRHRLGLGTWHGFEEQNKEKSKSPSKRKKTYYINI